MVMVIQCSVSTQSRPGFEAGSLLSGCFAICIVYFRRSKKTPRSTTNLLNDHEQLFFTDKTRAAFWAKTKQSSLKPPLRHLL